MTELVQRLNDFAPHWADAMWRATWQGGLAITVVWVLCSILPRIPARVRCWLWRLAFAKLLVCLFWATPIKIALLPAAKLPASVDPNVQTVRVLPPSPSPIRVQLAQSATRIDVSQNIVRPGIVALVLVFWALGVVVGIIGIARQWWLAQLLVRKSRKPDHDQIESDVVLLSERFGVGLLPEVRVADGLSTPLLAGFRHPTILVPQSFLDGKSPTQLRMMMAHELAHFKRRDLWWGWLAISVKVVLFFHPLVWLATKESRLTEEMAVDELTVTVCNLRPVDYAGMLVEVAARLFPSRKAEMVVGVVGSQKTLKRRLQAMKYISSMSNRRMIVAAVTITTVGLGVIVPWRIVAQEQTAGLHGAARLKPNATDEPAGPANGPLQQGNVSEGNGTTAVFVDAEGHYNYAGRIMELDQIASELKNALATDPKSSVTVQADQKAPFPRLVALLDKMNEAGISRVSLVSRVSIATLSRAVSNPQIFDIAFGVSRPEESKQSGPAAAGREGDYWNTVGVAWNNDHTESDLKFASGEPSPVQVRMVNLGGAWGCSGRMGVKAPMLDSFNYPMNNQGGNSQVTLNEVPPGKYDIYIYGHGTDPLYYGDYTLTVGNHKYGRKTTSNKSDAIENTTWVEGSQYVKFTGVEVASGDKVAILIQPGGEVTDHWGRTFSDAMICGLQLIPVR